MITFKNKYFFILTIIILFSSINIYAKTAGSLNARGFSLYKQEKYGEAIEFFRQAIEKDKKFALAHYNLACTLGVLRKMGKICEHDAYRETIVKHLALSVKLDPMRARRMLNDSDLDAVRDTFTYQLLTGLSPEKENDINFILQRVTWYSAEASFGNYSVIKFRSDGKMDYIRHSFTSKGESRNIIHGSFKVNGKNISIKIAGDIYDAVLKSNGELSIPGKDEFDEISGTYTDEPDECSA